MDLKLTPDQVADALIAQGYSEEDAMKAAGAVALVKYEPKTVTIQPRHNMMSKRTVPFLEGTHTLRIMNVHDKKRALPVLVNVCAEFAKQDPSFKSTEDFLTKGHDHAFNYLFAKVMNALDEYKADEYPEWLAAALEEIANITSTQAQPVDIYDLVSLPLPQMAELLRALYEVNKQDFLSLWAKVPMNYRTGIRSKLFTPALTLISKVKQLLSVETPD